jgi:hypothetical protein
MYGDARDVDRLPRNAEAHEVGLRLLAGNEVPVDATVEPERMGIQISDDNAEGDL